MYCCMLSVVRTMFPVTLSLSYANVNYPKSSNSTANYKLAETGLLLLETVPSLSCFIISHKRRRDSHGNILVKHIPVWRGFIDN